MTTPDDSAPNLPVRPIGRRSKFTPETCQRIIQAIGVGATLEAAAGAAGISETTLHRWLADAENQDATEELREFREEVYRARDALQVRVVAGSVLKAALGGYVVKRVTRTKPDGTVETEEQTQPADGRVGLELLARRYPRQWGRMQPMSVELTGAGGGPVQVEHAAVVASLAERLQQELASGRLIEGEVVDEEDV